VAVSSLDHVRMNIYAYLEEKRKAVRVGPIRLFNVQICACTKVAIPLTIRSESMSASY
jgi:hypothetical protein